MRRFLVSIVIIGLVSTCLPTKQVSAQDGSFVEGLFRTIAEAQLQREQRKRLEAEAARRQANPPFESRAPLPPGRVPPPILNNGRRPSTIRPVPYTPGNQPRIVNSPNVTRFTDALSKLIREIKFLTADLRKDAGRNSNIRLLLPNAYQLTAQAEAMLAQAQATNSLDQAALSYRSFDASLRQLSFQLTSTVRLDAKAASHLKNADRYLATMSRQFGTEIQVDRRALHEQMIIAATHIQTLLDDLQLARGASRSDLRSLTHDGRLLRQAILNEAAHVEELPYDQMTQSFTAYADQWRQYAVRVAQLGDPHLNRRLDRIGECGENTYALLLMRPPVNAEDLRASCQRLHRLGDELLDQMTLRSMTRLHPDLRIQVGEQSRQFDLAVQELNQLGKRDASPEDLSRAFTQADQAWSQLGPSLSKLSSINLATVSSVNRECQHLRRVLGVSQSPGSALAYEDLIQIAASLEGTAEYLEKEIDRNGRFIEPSSLRRDMSRAADDFHDVAKDLHAKLYDRRALSDMRRDGEKMAEAWRRLATAVNQLNAQGGAGGRGQRIAITMRDLQPKVASMAAALTIE